MKTSFSVARGGSGPAGLISESIMSCNLKAIARNLFEMQTCLNTGAYTCKAELSRKKGGTVHRAKERVHYA